MRDEWRDHADRRLREAGLRASAGRSAVVELLARRECLTSAQELARELSDRGGAGSQATVYRALDTLHGLGLVHRVDSGDGVARFEPADPTGEHHHHLVLEDTGEVVSFADAELEAAIEGIGRRLGIEMTGHDVILRGRREAQPGRVDSYRAEP